MAGNSNSCNTGPLTINSQYVESLIKYILDVKPYHTKLTEVVEEYQFEDDLNVEITDNHFIHSLLNSIWTYSFFSNGFNSQFRVPYNIIPKFLDTTHQASFIGGTDEDTQLPGVLGAYNNRYFDGVGIRLVRRGDIPQIESLDYHISQGAWTGQLKADQKYISVNLDPVAPYSDRDGTLQYNDQVQDFGTISDLTWDTVTPNYEEWTVTALVVPGSFFPETYEHVQAVASSTWTIPHGLNTSFIHSVFYIDVGLNIEQQQPLTFNDTGVSATVTFAGPVTGRALLQRSFTPSAYSEGVTISTAAVVWNIPHNLGTTDVGLSIYELSGLNYLPILPNQVTFVDDDNIQLTMFAPIIGKVVVGKGVDASDQFTHTQTTGSSTWTINHNLSSDDLAITAYRLNAGVYTIVNPTNIDFVDADNLTLTFAGAYAGKVVLLKKIWSSQSQIQFEVSGSITGVTGIARVTEPFTSPEIGFTIGPGLSMPVIGDTFILTPGAQITVHPTAPLEKWNIIKVNPLAYTRPLFNSTNVGFIDVVEPITNLATPTQTWTITALSPTLFSVVGSVTGPTANATVLVPYSNGHIDFTIFTGTQPFQVGDYFLVDVVNELATVQNLQLNFGYDLSSFDNDFYDARFDDYDVGALNLTVVDQAAADSYWELRALTPTIFSVTQFDNEIDRNVLTSSAPPFLDYADAVLSVPYNNGIISFTIVPATMSFIGLSPPIYGPPPAVNVGDAQLTNVTVLGGSPFETWTIRALSSTTFSVVGSVSGAQANATIDVPYSNAFVNFTVTDTVTPAFVGDIIGVNPVVDTFTFATNVTSAFPPGRVFRITGSTNNDGFYTVVSSVFGVDTVVTVAEDIDPGLPITAVNTTLDSLTVAGDQTGLFIPGVIFTVFGSTGNDGDWTVVSSSFGGASTEIFVAEDVTDPTADGEIVFTDGFVRDEMSFDSIGDIFTFNIVNPPPVVFDLGFVAPWIAYLTMYARSYLETPESTWLITFTSPTTFNIVGLNPDLTTLFSGSYDLANGDSYQNQYVHFTVNGYDVVPPIAFQAGDTFSFRVFDRKPTYLVIGDVSGWQEPAVVGEWYWNGMIGFKLPIPRYIDNQVGTSAVETPGVPNMGDGTLTFDRPPRSDTATANYLLKFLADESLPLLPATFFTVDNTNNGRLPGAVVDQAYNDGRAYFTVNSGSIPFGTGDTFDFTIQAHTLDLFQGHALVIFDDGNAPALDELVFIKKALFDRAFFRLQNAGVNFPELGAIDDWIPIFFELRDNLTSIAIFADRATIQDGFLSNVLNYRIGTLNQRVDPGNGGMYYTFDVDPAFLARYLPLNTAFDLRFHEAESHNHVAQARITEEILLNYALNINEDLTVNMCGPCGYDAEGGFLPDVNVPIIAVNTVFDTFTVAGNLTAIFPAGFIFIIAGSTGNDGSWTVDVGGATLSGPNTVIPVVQDITDATVDGAITLEAELLGLYDTLDYDDCPDCSNVSIGAEEMVIYCTSDNTDEGGLDVLPYDQALETIVQEDGDPGYFNYTSPTYGVNTGTGVATFISVVNPAVGPAQTWTMVATSPTVFSVTGSVSGAQAAATVDTPYTNGIVNFTIISSTVAFVPGDTITFNVVAAISAMIGPINPSPYDAPAIDEFAHATLPRDKTIHIDRNISRLIVTHGLTNTPAVLIRLPDTSITPVTPHIINQKSFYVYTPYGTDFTIIAV